MTNVQLPPLWVTGIGPGGPVIIGEEAFSEPRSRRNIHFLQCPQKPRTPHSACFLSPQSPVRDTPTWPPPLCRVPQRPSDMKPKLMYQEVGGWDARWGGLGCIGGEDACLTTLLLPLRHRPPPQLKVPVEEPAGELPVNEIEAWKAAEKVGVSCSP